MTFIINNLGWILVGILTLIMFNILLILYKECLFTNVRPTLTFEEFIKRGD